MTSSAPTSSLNLNRSIWIVTLCQVQTLFLLCSVRKMFGTFSSRPDAGKKTSSRGQGVTTRILSNSRVSTINSAPSTLVNSQKTGDYTYPTPIVLLQSSTSRATSMFAARKSGSDTMRYNNERSINHKPATKCYLILFSS